MILMFLNTEVANAEWLILEGKTFIIEKEDSGWVIILLVTLVKGYHHFLTVKNLGFGR